MTQCELPSPELLRQLLRYDPDTGKLYWRARPVEMFPGTSSGGREAECRRWNSRLAGKETFNHLETKGHFQGFAMGRRMMAHRVVWAIAYGRWPEDQIDHIDGCKINNRLDNLREVDTATNCQNRPERCDNTSGVTGVRFHARMNRWQAKISYRGKIEYLGTFTSFEEAVAVRRAAERRHGFHPNHGRQRPTNMGPPKSAR